MDYERKNGGDYMVGAAQSGMDTLLTTMGSAAGAGLAMNAAFALGVAIGPIGWIAIAAAGALIGGYAMWKLSSRNNEGVSAWSRGRRDG
jgi:hypothetical protein